LNLSETLPEKLERQLSVADVEFMRGHGSQKKSHAMRQGEPCVVFSKKIYRTSEGGCKNAEEFLLSYRVYALLYDTSNGQIGNVDFSYHWASLCPHTGFSLPLEQDPSVSESESLGVFVMSSGRVILRGQTSIEIGSGELCLFAPTIWKEAVGLEAIEGSEVMFGVVWRHPSPHRLF
tara:strand:+ start:1754 stop:2284 length:531 start_codon:yes stop_codon:yes gene_type:complete